jgi:aspartate aminotransferase
MKEIHMPHLLRLSKRVLNIRPSATIAIDSKAKSLLSQGIQLINLGAGEPWEPTPECAKEAGIQAIQENKTRYDHPAGLLPLRQALADVYSQKFKCSLTAEQFVVSSGAKQSLYHSLLALIDPGDEVLILKPYWVSYFSMVELLGGVPVEFETTEEENWSPNLEKLAQKISNKTKVIIINSPNNPSGMIYPLAWWKKLNQILTPYPISILSDEIYQDLTYGISRAPSVYDVPALREKSILVHGVSKSYRMTGWRIGFCLSTPEVAAKLSAIQSQTSHHPSLPAQYGALGAISNGQESLLNLRESLQANFNIATRFFKSLPQISFIVPQGAFYMLLNVKSLLNQKQLTDIQACEILLNQFQCVCMPGSAFGIPGYIRISLTLPQSQLELGLSKLRQFILQTP